ncbi:MAG: cytochrome P450 [Hyphomonadaceae bacterium]|nr:cytochrome P450 [Hyphomonadaceae bacterium]
MTLDRASARSDVRDVNFADPAFLARPWPELLRLQREAPVYWSENQKGWIITRHADVKAAFADPRLSAARVEQLFRSMPEDVRAQLQTVRKYLTLNVNRMDGPEHMRIRTLMLKAFDRGVVRQLEGFIDGLIDRILDTCASKGEFDFHAEVCNVLPTMIMQRLLGLPDEFQTQLFKLASDFTAASASAAITPELMLQLDRSIRSMNEIFEVLIKDRERNPGDDLISTLVHARDGLHRLSHDELLACFHAIIVAGAETTAHSLSVHLVEIARRPDIVARLRVDPDCAFALATELLRYPGTVKCMTRLAAEDFEWHGQHIRKGDLLWMMHAGANVDPEVFPDAFETDIDRNNRESFAFGPGLHHCVGHILARTEISMFMKRAFARFDVAILEETLEMAPSYIFFGYKRLRVRFTPRAA